VVSLNQNKFWLLVVGFLLYAYAGIGLISPTTVFTAGIFNWIILVIGAAVMALGFDK
jgi:hypothetical protein